MQVPTLRICNQTRLFYQNIKHLVTPHIQRKTVRYNVRKNTEHFIFFPFASIPGCLQACPETEYLHSWHYATYIFLEALMPSNKWQYTIKIPCRKKEWSKTRQHIKTKTKQRKIIFKHFYSFPLLTRDRKLGCLSDMLMEGILMNSHAISMFLFDECRDGNFVPDSLAHSYLDPSEMLLGTLPCFHFSSCHMLHMALDSCTWAAEQRPLIEIYSGQDIFFFFKIL